jgi:hypothetical protein
MLSKISQVQEDEYLRFSLICGIYTCVFVCMYMCVCVCVCVCLRSYTCVYVNIYLLGLAGIHLQAL